MGPKFWIFFWKTFRISFFVLCRLQCRNIAGAALENLNHSLGLSLSVFLFTHPFALGHKKICVLKKKSCLPPKHVSFQKGCCSVFFWGAGNRTNCQFWRPKLSLTLAQKMAKLLPLQCPLLIRFRKCWVFGIFLAIFLRNETFFARKKISSQGLGSFFENKFRVFCELKFNLFESRLPKKNQHLQTYKRQPNFRAYF